MFAWLTLNYALGNLESDVKPFKDTAAMIDLGGASSQIAFYTN
jgi:hypothetical protein